ncbi:MAG: hypothetical protein J6V54_10750 [Bacteroidales bacterium]|nr:hypothetical protein [Bacteroidales bacterium]
MNIFSSIVNAVSNIFTSSANARTAQKTADAGARQSNTIYRMLPLIILAAVVMAIVITKK